MAPGLDFGQAVLESLAKSMVKELAKRFVSWVKGVMGPRVGDVYFDFLHATLVFMFCVLVGVFLYNYLH